jgi:hypothetical protein
LEGALAEGTPFLILDSPRLSVPSVFRLTLISTVKRREPTPNEVPVQRHSPQVPPPAPKFELYYGARRGGHLTDHGLCPGSRMGRVRLTLKRQAADQVQRQSAATATTGTDHIPTRTGTLACVSDL